MKKSTKSSTVTLMLLATVFTLGDSTSDLTVLGFAFVANQRGISAYAINTGGSLTEIKGPPPETVDAPSSIALDPLGKLAYATNAGTGDVSVFAINSATGGLTLRSRAKVGTNPSAVGVDPAGKFVYVTNSGSSNVSEFSIDRTTGRLAPIAGGSVTVGKSPVSITVDPLGRFVYVANEGEPHPGFFASVVPGNISAYQVNHDTGALSELPGSPWKSGTNPSSVTLDSSSKFAYVTDGSSDDILEYTVNQTNGTWTPIASSPVKAGTNPVSLTIEQQGKFAYVADAGGSFVPQGDIRSYGIKSPTGALSEIGITKIVSHSFSGWYHRVQAIAVDPSGNFLLAVDSHESVVGVYMIDKTTGTLTEADGSPFATGRGPVSVCVSRKTP